MCSHCPGPNEFIKRFVFYLKRVCKNGDTTSIRGISSLSEATLAYSQLRNRNIPHGLILGVAQSHKLDTSYLKTMKDNYKERG